MVLLFYFDRLPKNKKDKDLTSDLPHSSITGLSPGSAAVSMVSPLAPGDPLRTNNAVPKLEDDNEILNYLINQSWVVKNALWCP